MTLFEKGNDLYLFSLDEFYQLPDGFELVECFSGKRAVKGIDDINLDTRFNHIAYGVRNIETHPERNLLLTFLLKR